MATTLITKNGITGTPSGLADGELAVDRVAGTLWVGNAGGVVPLVGSGATTAAASVSYDNAASGLTATEVQAAVDELDGGLDSAAVAIATNVSDISGKLGATAQAVDSAAVAGKAVVVLTQAAYDALTPDANTLYFTT